MNFRNKLIIPISFIVFLSMSILGVIMYFNVESSFEKQIIGESQKQLQLVEMIIDNQLDLEKDIKRELGSSYLPVANSIALSIDKDPNILNNENLNELSKQLMLDEINVVNGDGFITHSTVDNFIGYDMASSEQSKSFLEVISGNKNTMIQDPKVRGSDRILYQYIAVRRIDAPGLIQIGLDPKKVEQIDDQLKIDKYIRDMKFGKDGYAFILEKGSGKTLVHPNVNVEGTRVKEDFIDYIVKKENGYLRYSFEGVEKIVVFKTIGKTIIAITESLTDLNVLKKSILYLLIIVTVICLAISISSLYIIVTKFALNPIKRVMEAVGEMEKGNLTVQIPEKSKDEFGDLARSFNSMIVNIRNLVFNIINLSNTLDHSSSTMNDNARGIGAASEEVAKSIGEIAEGSSSQAQDANNALQLTNLLSSKVKTMTNTLTSVMTSSGEMNQKSEDGLKTLVELKEKLDENETASSKVSQSVSDLSDKSTMIESILKTIQNISEQINLLSLNATIEAARAGEHGRGFAVVADEIRRLSEDTNNSTGEIQNIIEEIQSVIGDTSINANLTSKSIENASITLAKTEDVFYDLKSSVENSISRINELNDDLIEVSKTKENTLVSIENISSITQESSAATEQISASTEEQTAAIEEVVGSIEDLNRMSKELTSLIGQFKVE
ncbi:methyl-accepting chemotaxis protein [Tissierella creatinophila]|uniref:Methyl-accepting chemotaxis protein McpB n=1 Tax=Tissierella creatinophila DSM 6911 TaxID=1123403 RepID=A0A1U7M7F9_TISCR|nr:methyl-accepting chemotaxis protein [Tissierella creatinophila]OLS03215.1 methyl-accepting chemotaxis protein McpB [Tissierella creatinophila DSM 6911]